MRVVTNRAGSTASDVAPIVAPITIEVCGNTANAARCHSLIVGIQTDPELKQWSNFRAAVRGEVGVHQQKREWLWGPCVT